MDAKSLTPGRLRMLGMIKGKNLAGPELVYLELTRGCNLNCLYCYYHSDLLGERELAPGSDMPFEKVKELVSEFAKLKVKKVWLTGEGEPFLYPKIGKVLKMIKAIGAETHFFTNATFGADALKLLPLIDRLYINLSASNRETYERLQDTRKSGFFDAVVSNIAKISALKERRGLHVSLEVNFIINKLNFREINGFILLCKKVGVDRINFSVLNQDTHNMSLILSDEDIKEFSGMLDFGLEPHPNTNMENIREIFKNESFIRSRQERRGYDGGLFRFNSCFLGWISSYIDIKGNVFVCCFRQKPEDIAGNIYDKSFSDIWNSQAFHEIRLRYRNRFDITDESWGSCRLCPFMGLNKSIYDRVRRLSE